MNNIFKKTGREEGEQIGFVLHFLMLIASFLCSTASVFDGYLPFGIAFVSGTPKKYIPAAAFGSAIGYLFFITKGGFAYIAALFAVATVKFILGSIRLSRTPLFSGILSFFVLLVVGIVMGVSYEQNLLFNIGQALLAFGSSYFISIIFKIVPSLSYGLDIGQSVAVLVFSGIILLSLYRFSLFGVNLGRTGAVLFILCAARFGRSAYGAVAGSVIGFMLSLFDTQLYSISACFSFCGLISGLFSRLGNLGMVGAYLTATLTSTLIYNDQTGIWGIFFEALIGGGIFLLLPKSFGNFLRGILSPKAKITPPDTIKGSLVMRLEFAASALRDIFTTVEQVAGHLKKINAPDFEKTLSEIEEDVCVGCSLRKHCWETAREITAEDALRLWGRERTHTPKEDMPLKMNCLRNERFEQSVSKRCNEFDIRKKADNRVSEIRGIISDQFSAISNMLYDLCQEFKFEIQSDPKAAEDIILTLKHLGFHTVSCVTAIDKQGRLSADIHIKGTSDHKINKMEIVKALSLACEKDFDTPSVALGDDEALISISERPNFCVEVGFCQIPEEKGKLCGDSFKYFCDGKGRFIMILSDGMGTGGRAAVDSAMVSGLMAKMLASGFGYDCSLKIINSSMLFKSTDESLATVDISAIDLFTGECVLKKAGAAPTVIRRGNKIGKAESSALPPGILRDVVFDSATTQLNDNDIVVMMSDGATTEGCEWIKDKVTEFKIGSAQQLADKIAFAAKRRRKDGHNDDITVLTAIIKKQTH